MRCFNVAGGFMPFKSKAQQKYLYAKLPEIARKFSEETPSDKYKKLPEHKRKKDEKRHKRNSRDETR